MATKISPPEELFPAQPSTGNAIPYPYPDQPGAGTPPDVSIPNVSNDLLSSSDVPVPSTTVGGTTTPSSPGPALTNENNDFGAVASNAPGVTSEQTVQGQLEGLFTNTDLNPLWNYARGQGTQYANSRGLVNSSIAAEAGTQAIFAQALPIASQDANTFASRAQQEAGFWQTAGLQAQSGTIQSSLAAQDHMQRLVEMSKQGDINSKLQLEQFGYNFQLNEQQNLHNMSFAALQGDIQKQLALQQFGFDIEKMREDFGYRTKLVDMELRNALSLSSQDHSQWLERIEADHVNALDQIGAQTTQQDEQFRRDLQGSYLGAVERRTSQFSAEVTSIYQTQGLTPAQQQTAVGVARANYQQDLSMLQSFYAQSPHWDSNWGGAQPPAINPGQPAGLADPRPPLIPGPTTPGRQPFDPGTPNDTRGYR